MTTQERAEEIKIKYQSLLFRYPNVNGVGLSHAKKNGINTGEWCIYVSVVVKLPLTDLRQEDIIPTQLEGVRVDVEAVGHNIPY